LARYAQLVAQGENALDLLVGTPVNRATLPADLSGVTPPRELSPGVSSEVLLQRPDISAAEHQLMAANANIGAARSAFFPQISLLGGVGTASSELDGLFDAKNRTWNFGPQISMPIFDARVWAAKRVTEADQKIAVAQYERVIQTSFREVADTLAVRGTIDEQVAAQESLVQSQSETYRLSQLRYDRGLDSYLSVLDAQRSLYLAQRGLVVLKFQKLANQVNLYQVLGGGWLPAPVQAAATTQPSVQKS
jgi:multidrug efflux system outer membrane protein